jgi:hypothetical protein
VVFIAVLLLAGAFHRWQLWLVLIPALVVQAVWFCILKFAGFSSSEGPLFSQIFVPTYIGIAILIALAYRIRMQNRSGLLILAAVVMALGILLSYFAYNYGGTNISEQSRMALVFDLILSAAFLLALAMAGFLCRKRFTRLRFAPWLFGWSFLLVFIFTCIFGWIDYHPTNMDMALEVIGIGAILGLGLCGLILPFLILAFLGPFHKQFFPAYQHLSPEPQEQQSEDNLQVT